MKQIANFHSKINTKIEPATISLVIQNTLHNVCTGLYFSDYHTACNYAQLQQNTITHIINCASDSCESRNYPGIQYHNAVLQDTIEFDLLGFLSSIIPWIDTLLAQGGRVLVHCSAGRSRGPSVISGYMIWKNHKSVSECADLLKRLDGEVDINIGFLMQLESWSKSLGIKYNE